MSDQKLTISEIFFSIQGESSRMGFPCIFIRLSFCNLRCSWCDSEYTFYAGDEMSFESILDQIKSYPTKLVEVTGGEPLAQENATPFMKLLCDSGYDVLLETSGSLDISRVDPRVKRIVDFKCPGSSMAARNRWKNVNELTKNDEVKFVIKDRLDYEWAKNEIQRHSLPDRCPVLMSPVFCEIENVDLANWILDDGIPVRYQLQMHKYIWDPKARGV